MHALFKTITRCAAASVVTWAVCADAGEKPKGIKRERLARGVVTQASVDALRAAPAAASASTDRLVLDLFPEVRHTASVKKTAIAGGTGWSGRVDGCEHSSVTIVQVGDVVAGSVTIPGEGSFVLNPGPDGETRILEMDTQAAPPCLMADEAPAGSAAFASAYAPAGVAAAGTNQVAEVFDLLMLFTPSARDLFGGATGMQAKAEALVFGLNEAFANSAIKHRVRLVRTADAPTTRNPELRAAFSDLINLEDGFLDDVQAMRSACQADLVTLITGDQGFSFDGIAGVATLASAMFPANSRYSDGMSVVDAMWADYAFAHEIGHNLGCAHDRANAGGQELHAFNYGYRWKGLSGNLWRDIMAYAPGMRVPHFSNPDVFYDGILTGIPADRPNAADCARTINMFAGVVADYRTSDRDGDGMGDEWERRHGLNPADPRDARDNADGDSYCNVEEFLRYLNPNGLDSTPSGFDSAALHVDDISGIRTNELTIVDHDWWEVITELKPTAPGGFYFTANRQKYLMYGELNQTDFTVPLAGRTETGYAESPVNFIEMDGPFSGLYRMRFNPGTLEYAVDNVPGLKWSGNVEQFPAGGQITPTNDLWVSVETYPTGVIREAFVMTSVTGANWRAVPMGLAGRSGNNDRWSANLGKHVGSATVTYSIGLVDRAGMYRVVNQARQYNTTINPGQSVEWVANIRNEIADGQQNPIEDVVLIAESWPRGSAAYARFVYTTNGVSWRTVDAERSTTSSANDVWRVNLGKFSAGTHVQYYVQVVDGKGVTHTRNSGGWGYGVLCQASGESVKWAGNVTTWPPQGQVDAGERLWIDLETWPATAADSGIVEFTCDGLRWETLPLEYAGRKGNNAWWHVPLGRFAEGKEILFRAIITDGRGQARTLDHGGKPFAVTVNESRHAPQFHAIDPFLGNTRKVEMRYGNRDGDGRFKLGTLDARNGIPPVIIARPVERGDGSQPDVGPISFTSQLRYTLKSNDWSSAKSVPGITYVGGYNNEPFFEYVAYTLPADVLFADDIYFYLVAQNAEGAGYATKPGEVFHIRIASEVTP